MKKKEIKLLKMKETARSRGGKCLSTEYHGSRKKHLWECSEGHRWAARYNSVENQGRWCPYCAGRRRRRRKTPSHEALLKMQKTAESRGGKCLSTEYRGSRIKHLWECSEGHRWAASYNSVVNMGTWCLHCAGRRPSHEAFLKMKETAESCCGRRKKIPSHEALLKMKEAAESRGGKCLSKKYHGSGIKHLWECSEGHQWEARYSSVVNMGTWCPHCVRKRKRKKQPGKALLKMKKTAKSRGGKCLSKKYHGSRIKYLWECRNGHQWEATYNGVVSMGTWCPRCGRTGKGKSSQGRRR